jgi:hypothetical protein
VIPTELAKVVDWIEDRWPGTKAWRYADKIAHDYLNLPETAVWEAAWNYYNSGARTAPTTSELRESALRIARAKGELDPQATDCDARGHHGALAIADLEPKDGEPRREAQCVDCHTIRIGTPAQFPTVGERAAREKGLGPDAPEDLIADRIAP